MPVPDKTTGLIIGGDFQIESSFQKARGQPRD